MWACCPSGVVDKEAETPHEACTHMVESSTIRRHHVSKDFCTPVIKEVCSGSKEEKFGSRTHAQKTFSCCSLFLWTVTITASVRDSCQYSNNHLLPKLTSRQYFILYGILLHCDTYIETVNINWSHINIKQLLWCSRVNAILHPSKIFPHTIFHTVQYDYKEHMFIYIESLLHLDFWVLVLTMAAREIIIGKVSSVHVAITYVYKATYLDTRNGKSFHCESGKNDSSTAYVIWIIYRWVSYCIVPEQEKHENVRLAPAVLAPIFSKGDKQNISHVCILLPSFILFFTFGLGSLKFVSSAS